MEMQALDNIALALLLAPLFIGVTGRTKALFAGRRGRPVFQAYFDVFKLLRKGAVYSRTTTFVFRMGPAAALSSALAALVLLPMGGSRSLIHFTGDFVLFAYLFGLGRFFTVLAALDTGSSFEGMGASREAAFSALTEPVLFLGFLALVSGSGGASLSGFLMGAGPAAGPRSALVAASFFLVMLAENSRIPIDDPDTHLELTMIHEVMALDHSGPDLALIQYGLSLKLWAFGSLALSALLSFTGTAGYPVVFYYAGMFGVSVAVGIVESVMARIRLLRFTQYIAAAAALAVSALALSITG